MKTAKTFWTTCERVFCNLTPGFYPWSLILTLCFPPCNFWSSGSECSYRNQVTSPLSSTSCLLYGAPSPLSLSVQHLALASFLVATLFGLRKPDPSDPVGCELMAWLFNSHLAPSPLGNSLGSITSRLYLSLAWFWSLCTCCSWVLPHWPVPFRHSVSLLFAPSNWPHAQGKNLLWILIQTKVN